MEEKQVEKISKRSSKFKAFFITSIVLCVFGCFLVFIFLWYGGYVKEFVCNAVKQDSLIWTKSNCVTTTSEQDSTKQFPLEPTIQLGQNINSNEDATVESVVNSTNGSVVGIGLVNTANDSANQIIGSGFVISKSGLIVTNRHVVEDESSKYYIAFKDDTNTVEISSTNIFRDPVNDIALIKIDNNQIPSNVKALVLGDSDNLNLGQTVITIGNPLGKYSGTVTKGIISGLNREVTITKGFFSTQKEIYSDVIQTDAAINPGNSGGPMINLNGEAVGINFATVEGASNLSFALPINRIKSRINELEENGKFRIPYVGVEYKSKVMFINNQTIIGSEIVSVIDKSPAQNAGLLKGDIIVDFNGSSLESETLLSLIQKTTIGSKISMVIYRNNQQKTLEVIIGER